MGRNLGGGTWEVVGDPIGGSLFESTVSQWKGFEQANDVMELLFICFIVDRLCPRCCDLGRNLGGKCVSL